MSRVHKRANGEIAHDTRQPEERLGLPELIGDDTNVKLKDVDSFLYPMMHADALDGSLQTFKVSQTLHAKVTDALAASLPPTIGAWLKYQPKLVNTSRFEIVGLRYRMNNPLDGWKEFTMAALRSQPDMMDEAREAASAGRLYVHFHIKSTPLTRMLGIPDFE